MTNKLISPLATSLLVLGLLGCSSGGTKEVHPRVVKTMTVEQGAGQGTTTLPAKVVASQEAKLAFRIPGVIQQIQAHPGVLIRRGTVLATLDARDYQTQLAATQAEYVTIKAQADRVAKLYAEQSVSANDYDKAMGGLRQITEKLTAHRNAVQDTRLVAPYDCYVEDPLRKVGETVAAGMPILSVHAGGVPEVTMDLSNQDYRERATIERYTLTVDADGGTTYPLELVSIDPIARNGQLHQARLRFAGEMSTLPVIGTSALVQITHREQTTDEYRIPMSAIWERDGNSFVWEVIAQGEQRCVAPRAVRVVSIGRDGTATAQGLSHGVEIVTAGVQALTDSMQVRTIAPQSKTNAGNLL